MKNLKKFTKVWLMNTSRAAQIQLLTSWSGILFIFGKTLSFLVFFIFLFTVLSSSWIPGGTMSSMIVRKALKYTSGEYDKAPAMGRQVA